LFCININILMLVFGTNIIAYQSSLSSLIMTNIVIFLMSVYWCLILYVKIPH